jgi:DNA primase
MIDITEIRYRVKIQEVISKYIQIEYKNESNYKACCPFHKEKTPSMLIEVNDQYYKCFGCGASGNVINFVADYLNIDYYMAAKIIARDAGIHWEDKDLDLLKDVNLFFTSKLAQIEEYLTKRELPLEFAKIWNLGYSGEAFELAKEFGAMSEDLERLGLIRCLNKSTPAEVNVSVLGNRLTFSIENNLGIIGFAGRTIIDASPKYLNTPDNEYYNKRKILYGFKQARDQIENEGYAFLVEGFFDTITMHKEGWDITTNAMGTSLSDEQATLISHACKKVIMLYDGDNAGRLAIKRNIAPLLRAGIDFKVMLLSDGEDPDSYLRGGGKIQDLEIYDMYDTIKELLKYEDLIEIVNKAPDPSVLNNELLMKFKIDVDLLFKKRVYKFKPDTKSAEVTNFTHIALLCSEFEELRELLNENEEDLVELENGNPAFIELKLKRIYKKVKDPKGLLVKFKGG